MFVSVKRVWNRIFQFKRAAGDEDDVEAEEEEETKKEPEWIPVTIQGSAGRLYPKLLEIDDDIAEAARDLDALAAHFNKHVDDEDRFYQYKMLTSERFKLLASQTESTFMNIKHRHIQEVFQPKASSEEGFVLADQDPCQLIADDLATLEAVGVQLKTVASVLWAIRMAVQRIRDEFAGASQLPTVFALSWTGGATIAAMTSGGRDWQNNPLLDAFRQFAKQTDLQFFGPHQRIVSFGKPAWFYPLKLFRDANLNMSTTIHSLTDSLIAQMGFFQGGPYREDPLRLLLVLNMLKVHANPKAAVRKLLTQPS